MDTGIPETGRVEGVVDAVRRRVAIRRVPLLVAIDGRSGVGKSTLAASVAAGVEASVVAGDDFYAGGTDAEWLRRTAADKADRCIDWRRLRTEALEPLCAGRPAAWHPFDFAAGAGLAAQTVSCTPAAVIVLDGIYSARPELRDLVDLAVLIDVPDDRLRRERLVAREGATFMADWHTLWDEAEDYYFAHVCPRESFDLIITKEVITQSVDDLVGSSES